MAITRNCQGSKQHFVDRLLQVTGNMASRLAEWLGVVPEAPQAIPNSNREHLATAKKKLEHGHRNCMTLQGNEKNQFLPGDIIGDTLTKPMMRSFLLAEGAISRRRLNNIVEDERHVKLFAILVLGDMTEHFGLMVGRGFSDDALPLPMETLKSVFQPFDDCFRFVNHFTTCQSSVAVPSWDFTSSDTKDREYPNAHSMPFLTKERLSDGGQGIVWKVKIHPAHFTGKGSRAGSKGPEFAVKEFSKRDDFHQELTALQRFNQSETKHKHLLRVLAAYSQAGKHFLILPLAKGDLSQFWADNGPYCKDPLWLLRQCYGLADGLYRIHKYEDRETLPPSQQRTFFRGRHGDIKPPNILWFEDQETGENRLVISDFTLVRFHADGSNTATLAHKVGWTLTYRAPEVDGFAPRGVQISQQYDVWSLGCVFLEFISCHLVGFRATRGPERFFNGDDHHRYETFNTTRLVEELNAGTRGPPEDKFFIYRGQSQEAEVKASVIREHMLVIHPSKRWGMEKVRGRLQEIQKADSNKSCSDQLREAFHPRDLLCRWNESSYGERLSDHVNAACSGLVPSTYEDGDALSDHLKRGMDVLESAFLQTSSPSYGPRCSPITMKKTTDADPEDESHAMPEGSSTTDDRNRRGISQDPVTRDADLLCAPPKSLGPPSSKEPSIFTQDLGRPASSYTGCSSLDPDSVPEQIRPAEDKPAVVSEPEAKQEEDSSSHVQTVSKESTRMAEMKRKPPSPKQESAIRRTWMSLTTKVKITVTKRHRFVRGTAKKALS